jgi:hypothetical protein
MRTASASAALKFIPFDAVMRHQTNIKAKLADAVAALRAADDKLGQATDEFNTKAAFAAFCEADDKFRDTRHVSAADWKAFYDDCSLQKSEIQEARYGTRFLADMLDAGHPPTLHSRVFNAIASYGNEDPRNTPHIEGAVIALRLAERSFTSALKLAKQLDGEEPDEDYQQAFAVRGIVAGYVAFLVSGSFVFDHEKALDALVDAKRTLAMAA